MSAKDNVIVTDKGFTEDDWSNGYVPLAEYSSGKSIDLGPEDDPADLIGRLNGVDMIRVDFPSFADGRGFTTARILRRMGYAGRLRAKGHVIADQYAMVRRSGFDEVEIDAELAQRQPQDQWLFRSDWVAHDYQSRLRG